jgi:hypothetical protein
MGELSNTVVTLVGMAGIWLAIGAGNAARPALVGNGLGGPELASLEAEVSRSPANAEALHALTETYLAHDAPGLAQAALERAPRKLLETPQIADVRARTLWGLGSTEQALTVQRTVLASCSNQPCSPALVARARQRERLLDELQRVGVEDPKEDPERVLLAYRRSTREVTLDIE